MVELYSYGKREKTINFPSGETQVYITSDKECLIESYEHAIFCDWESDLDTFKILLLNDSLKQFMRDTVLIIKYLPYSRQDRITSDGASFSLKCFADVINTCGFKRIFTWDVHSNVAGFLIKNLVNEDQSVFIYNILYKDESINCIITPDAGAYKKIYDTLKNVDKDLLKSRNITVVSANKIRDVITGDIVSTTIDNSLIKGKNCLVLDDICDGGRTFIELAKVCKEHESLSLAVTHGFFSKGLDELSLFYKAIYSANTKNKDVITIDYTTSKGE